MKWCPSMSGIDGDEPRQDGGHFDEGVGLRHLDSARFLENDHEVETEVGEERKRVSRIDGKRRQNGEDLRLKVFFEPLPLFLVEFVDAVEEYPYFLEPGQDLLHDAPVLFGNERAHFFCDFVELLPDRPAACIDAIDIRVEDAEETADTDHEVLVEVRAEDGGELQFFKGGSERVLGLFEHAPVELQP